MRNFWRALHGSDQHLDRDPLQAMAGTFSRRVRAWAEAHGLPLIDCVSGQRNHELAESYRPKDPQFTGVFLIPVAKAPALVWESHPRQKRHPAPGAPSALALGRPEAGPDLE